MATTERVFAMPDPGEGLSAGEVVAWLVAEGDQVALNQPLVEVETDKATVEIPSPVAGRIVRLHADEGATVPVGDPLVTFEVDAATGRVPATPAVRAEARRLGVDIDAVTGTGAQGRVSADDVRATAERGRSAAETAPYDVEEVTGLRRVSAERLERVVRETPLVTTFRTLDCVSVQAVRTELGVSPLPVILKALADTCGRHPSLNACWLPDPPAVRRYRRVDVGLGIDTQRGLALGVVRDVAGRSVPELAREIQRLAEDARAGGIALADAAGSTISVSNTGTYGSEAGTPIPEPGVAAVLAIGVIAPRALVIDGEVQARPACTLSLTFDHRVLDGATAGRALTDLVDLLQDGRRLRDLAR